jgi:hypothetical protein
LLIDEIDVFTYLDLLDIMFKIMVVDAIDQSLLEDPKTLQVEMKLAYAYCIS